MFHFDSLLWYKNFFKCVRTDVFSLIQYHTIWNEVTIDSPHLRNGSYVPLPVVWSICEIYLEFFCTGYLSLLSYLFIQSFIYISMDSRIFILLNYNPVLHLFFYSDWSKFGQWEIFQLVPVTHLHQ